MLPDAGFPGTVVHIATRGVTVERTGDDVLVHAEAGEPWDPVVERTVAERLAGFEALSGIPGSTGATPVQNVGAYGQEISDTLVAVDVYDRATGETVRMPAGDCGLGYRSSRFKYQDRLVVLGASFRLVPGPVSRPVRYAELARRLGVPVGGQAPLAEVRAAVLALRRGKGMVLDPDDPDATSAGSFFTNPVLDVDAWTRLQERAGEQVPHYDADDGRVKVPAAWLIEHAGFGKGYGDGPVGISTKHTLALVHRGGGRTADLLALARTIRDGVRETFGVELHPEPVIVGTAL